jgi:3-hydroxyacyl-CoA dehydrogenase
MSIHSRSQQGGNMSAEVRKVAVLGAGVMGQGIVAHLANAGVPSILFDIVPADAPASDRSRLARLGIENALKLKPAAFFRKEGAELVTPANYEDHASLLADCDLVIEVVLEVLAVKKKVFSWVAANRRPGSIVSSNTSGLSLASMTEGMDEELKQHFLVTHFFNPVRYMRLLELVAGPETLPEVVRAVSTFGEKVLGKGIVYGKDTPNFIANRIGVFGTCSVLRNMERFGANVEEVDAIFGKAMGRPASAVFRTADIVGIDTFDHVLDNVRENCTSDEQRDTMVAPAWLKGMIQDGALGDKTGRGFYKKIKDAEGKSVILFRNLATGEYQPTTKVRFESAGKAMKAGDVRRAARILVNAQDKAGQLAWACTSETLVYAANRVPEIADDIVNVDRGMCWGYGWEIGPFETWDAIGVAESVARMEAEGRTVTPWVKEMLALGRDSFFSRNADGRRTYWDPLSKAEKPIPVSDRWLLLSDLKAAGKVYSKGISASLLDLGDGVLGLEFHGKMNTIDDEVIGTYERALDELDSDRWVALVVGNQGGSAFSAGANLMAVGMVAMQKEWAQLERMVLRLQTVLGRAKHSAHPVVTAPWGLTLAGGCEVAMQSSATQASGELYMGLVEVGVGVIPAGGGCKEMLCRTLGDIPEGTEYDPNPFVQNIFRNMALAKVSMSAEEARGMGYLRPCDRLSLDPDALIHDAKNVALGLVKAGYRPPRKRRFMLPGNSGRAAIELFLYQMREGGYATDHDVTVGRKLAGVLTGGDVPSRAWVEEDRIIELEREAFLSLAGDPKTQQRIMHMLETGKPLRN